MSSISIEFTDYLRDNFGKVLIAAGTLLVILGVFITPDFYFTISPLGVVLAVTLFLGVVFVAYGFFVQVGLFSGRLRSINGLGTILLCVSVAFFAMAIVAIQFQLVTGFETIGMPSRGGGKPSYVLIPDSVRPFLFLFGDGLWLGAAFLAASMILKAVGSFRL
jgi:hypothetical protein